MGIFEEGVRQKIRFSYRGLQSIEDVCDFAVGELDAIYSQLMAQRQASNSHSLLKKVTRASKTLELKISIITRIVELKQAEAAAKVQLAVKHSKAMRLKELIAAKKDAALGEMSVEDLEKMAGDLEDGEE